MQCPHKDQRILIQIDTQEKEKTYDVKTTLINELDMFFSINTTPPSVLLSQKLITAFNRKRAKGRDFYDIVFLLGLKIAPDYNYLEKYISISNPNELKDYINSNSSTLNFTELAKDVEPFLFNPQAKNKVELFKEYLEGYRL